MILASSPAAGGLGLPQKGSAATSKSPSASPGGEPWFLLSLGGGSSSRGGSTEVGSANNCPSSSKELKRGWIPGNHRTFPFFLSLFERHRTSPLCHSTSLTSLY